jgi:hypothetical protein
MRISDDKINYLANAVTELLARDDSTEFKAGKNDIRQVVKRTMIRILRQDEELERRAAEKVRSLKRGVVEGTPEWDILLRRYYEEEVIKLRSIR